MPIPLSMNIDGAILQYGGSLIAILVLAGIAYWLKLGGAPAIQTDDQATKIANEIAYGFKPVELALDNDGQGALLADHSGRLMVLKPHGSHFAGRILTDIANANFSDGKLTVSTGERRFGKVSLNLPDGEIWAKRIKGLRTANHA